MERETKTIKTPGGKEVRLKTYLTARERNELRAIFLENMKFEGTQVKEIDGGVVDKAERKLLELVVVSYNGSAENIIERLLEERPEEYDFVVSEANKISTGNFPRPK
jgi:hypothetical protein